MHAIDYHFYQKIVPKKKKVNKYLDIYTKGKVASIIWLITPSYTISSTYKPIIIYEVYFNI